MASTPARILSTGEEFAECIVIPMARCSFLFTSHNGEPSLTHQLGCRGVHAPDLVPYENLPPFHSAGGWPR